MMPPIPATYIEQVNYTGHCLVVDRPCDSMTLVYDLDHDRQVTVVFGIAATFLGKACDFHRVKASGILPDEHSKGVISRYGG